MVRCYQNNIYINYDVLTKDNIIEEEKNMIFIAGIILLIGGILGIIKPELMLGRKVKENLKMFSEQEMQKKLRNMRILSIGMAILGLLSVFGKI